MKRKFKFSATDYTKAMLPQNRRQVFFDVLQLQWRKLLLLGLLLLLCYLPLLLSTFTADVYISNFYIALEGANQEALLQAGQTLANLDLIRNAANILLFLVLAVGFSGTLRVIRQYAWAENVHLPTDLGKGIRDNYWHTAAIFALAGIVYCLCLSVYYTAPSYGLPILSYLSIAPIGISALVVLPILMIALVMLPVYSNPLGTTLKNAFFIYSRCLWKVLAAALCSWLIWIPSLIPNVYCHIFGSLLGILLTPFALLGWTLFCYDCFDAHFNPQVCPQLIGKGIFPDR